MHLRRHGGAVDVAALGRIDAVLISHAHLDHLDVPSLRKLAGPQTELVVPAGASKLVAGLGFGAVHELRLGGRTEVAGAIVEATIARHDGRRHPLHSGGECVGYVIAAGGRRVYFAGDTELFPEMEQIRGAGLDAALIPVWGWGTKLGPGHLDPQSAAEALTLLRPRLAVPIHWGTLLPIGLDRLRGRGKLLTDPPHAFVAAADRLAPNVEVRVLEQGESTPLPPCKPAARALH
jgi:L-ascorbate metabolism protein UlaG (beta-lactamase superfamily)